jgi:SAM-dependent methyltransferase
MGRAELLIGCGASRVKQIGVGGTAEWSGLVTLDMNDTHKPDVVHDLDNLPLPFPDNSFDEIHGYEVMEHVGRQGDWRFFFAQWSDFWRILKPSGFFCGSSPHHTSPWAWGDPGHTRVVTWESFSFLSQYEYRRQQGNTPMTDYRFCYQADMQAYWHSVSENKQFFYILQAIKPSRINECQNPPNAR